MWCHGKCPEPGSGGGKYRIGDSRSNGRNPRFTDPSRVFLALHEVNLDLGRFAYAQHRIIVEVALLDSPGLEGDGPMQRGRETKDDSTFHLSFHRIGIDVATAIDDAHHPMNPHLAFWINRRGVSGVTSTECF